MKNHEIDYKLMGEEMQCVEIELDPQEAVIAEPGSFMMMTDGIEMQTLFGNGDEKGFMDKLFTAGKRLLTGENLFMTVYTNNSSQKRQVTFAAPYSGKIIPMNLAQLGGKIICQKDSFLCAAKGVQIGIEFQKKWEPDCSAEKVLSCRRWRVTEWLLYTAEAMWWKDSLVPVKYLR
jgi:uncharacterized protein (AIM24 family)